MVTLSLYQLSTLLNSMYQQATGKVAVTPTNEHEFVSLATTLLQTGYDPVLGAVSQVLGRTINSVRPYDRKFKGLEADAQTWGYITRKLTAIDKPFVNDDRYGLTDGVAVDMYTVNKPTVLETHFYGGDTYSKSITLFKDQLDMAFKSSDEFGRFVTMCLQNVSDMFEQAYEAQARNLICNKIAGQYTNASNIAGGVIHLVTEYNTAIGASPALTLTDLMAPDKYPAFMQWVYARVAKASAMLTERSAMYHANVTSPADKTVMRHTPYDKQNIYMLSDMRFGMEARVLADTYHDNYLKYANVEYLNFWQGMQTPDTIKAKPAYMANDGTETVAANAVTVSNVFGLIIDKDALMYTIMNAWEQPTPFNSRGAYTNIWYHRTVRWAQDDTENCVLFLLD